MSLPREQEAGGEGDDATDAVCWKMGRRTVLFDIRVLERSVDFPREEV